MFKRGNIWGACAIHSFWNFAQGNIFGSYVARIYKSVELNEEGTEVVDSKKLHKYDAAFYSKMSMNVSGGEKGNGVLNINAENHIDYDPLSLLLDLNGTGVLFIILHVMFV